MDSQRQAAGHSAGTLWFIPPGGEENRRRALTRDRVVAEALAIISGGPEHARPGHPPRRGSRRAVPPRH
jgi:hypothetical protein